MNRLAHPALWLMFVIKYMSGGGAAGTRGSWCSQAAALHRCAAGRESAPVVVHTADSRVLKAQALLSQGKRQEAMAEFNELCMDYPKFARGEPTSEVARPPLSNAAMEDMEQPACT